MIRIPMFQFLCMSLLVACESNNPQVYETGVLPMGAEIAAYDEVEGLSKAVVKTGDFITSDGDVKNGLRHGSWASYHADGLIQKLTTFHEG